MHECWAYTADAIEAVKICLERGLDIESAAWVWSQLLERRTDGTGIVFASADLDELLRYSDRIAVFFEGRIIEVVAAAATDSEALGHLIGGRRK